MAEGSVSPDKKWMLTQWGWLFLNSDDATTPDGQWSHNDGTFVELKTTTEYANPNSKINQVKDLGNNVIPSEIISTKDSVIIGDVNANITVKQGLDIEDVTNAILQIFNQLGIKSDTTPNHISEENKQQLNQTIEDYDKLLSLGAEVNTEAQLIVANASKVAGNFDDAIRRYIEIITSDTDSPEGDSAIQYLCQILIRVNRLDEAEIWLKKSKNRFEYNLNWTGLGNTLVMLGTLNANRLNYEDAIDNLMEARQLSAKENLVSTNIRAITNLGIIYKNTNKLEQAKSLLNEALVLARTNQDEVGVQRITLTLADINAELGDLQGAMELRRGLKNRNKENHDKYISARIAYQDGKNQEERGNYTLAKESYTKAKLEFKKIDAMKDFGEVCIDLGELLEELQEYSSAIINFEEAAESFDDITQVKNKAYCLYWLGSIYITQSDFSTAIEYSTEAVRLCETIGDNHTLVNSLVNLAIALSNTGQMEIAKSKISQARRLALTHGLDLSGIPII